MRKLSLLLPIIAMLVLLAGTAAPAAAGKSSGTFTVGSWEYDYQFCGPLNGCDTQYDDQVGVYDLTWSGYRPDQVCLDIEGSSSGTPLVGTPKCQGLYTGKYQKLNQPYPSIVHSWRTIGLTLGTTYTLTAYLYKAGTPIATSSPMYFTVGTDRPQAAP